MSTILSRPQCVKWHSDDPELMLPNGKPFRIAGLCEGEFTGPTGL